MPIGGGSEWMLEGGAGQTLVFDGSRAFGFGGVNRLTGEYTLDGDVLELGPIASTRMAGPPEAMQSESDYFGALARVARAAAVGGTLVLFDDDGSELLRFVPANPQSQRRPRPWS